MLADPSRMANILQKRQVHCYNGNSIAEVDKYIAKRKKSMAIQSEFIATRGELLEEIGNLTIP